MENGERGEPRGIVKTERHIWAVTSAQQRPLWRIFSTHSPSIRPGLMSMHSVTFQYRFRTLAGTDVIGGSIMGRSLQVVFPFRDPMSGPNICSAASTSAGVT